MYWNIALKLVVGSIGMLAILRFIGKKAISEMTPFDLIYLLVLGGLIEGSVLHHSTTVFHLLFAMGLWAVTVYVFELAISRTTRLSKVLQGEPSVLIDEGKINLKEIEKNHIDLEQLRAMLRQHGCYKIFDVSYAILETNGQLSVIKKSNQEVPSVLIVDEGRIDEITLESIGKDKKWLRERIRQEANTEVEDLVYCEWMPDGTLYYTTYSEISQKEKHLDG